MCQNEHRNQHFCPRSYIDLWAKQWYPSLRGVLAYSHILNNQHNSGIYSARRLAADSYLYVRDKDRNNNELVKKIEVDFLQRDIDTPVGNALATLKRHKSFDPLTRNEKIAIGKFAAFQTRRGPETVLAWHRVCANDTPEVAYPALRKMLEKSAIDFLDQCDDVWFHSLVGAKFSAFLGSDKPVVDIYDYLGFPGAFCPIGPHFCLFFKPKHSTFPRSEYELRNELLRHDFLRTINLAMCQLQPDYIFAENEAWDVLVSREYLGESIRRPRPAPFGSSGT